jgi:hypothetical protein
LEWLLLRTRFLVLTLASLSPGLGFSACATQREQRVSSAEARERPSDEACQPQGKPPSDRHVWGCGYWHWDSVRYVWVEGRWELPR